MLILMCRVIAVSDCFSRIAKANRGINILTVQRVDSFQMQKKKKKKQERGEEEDDEREEVGNEEGEEVGEE